MKWSSAAPPWFPPPKGLPTLSPGERKLHCGLFTFLPNPSFSQRHCGHSRQAQREPGGICCVSWRQARKRHGWEYGTRRPSGAARKLLFIARKNPKILVEA
jgi:hypothetical protein